MKDRNHKIKLIATIVGMSVLAISAILGFLFYLGINNAESLNNNLNISFLWTVIIAVIALVFAFLIGPIMSVLSNPKSIGKSLISIVFVAIIFILAFVFAKGDPNSVSLIVKPENLDKTVYLTEAGLYSAYAFAIIAILALIFSEIKNIFKI